MKRGMEEKDEFIKGGGRERRESKGEQRRRPAQER